MSADRAADRVPENNFKRDNMANTFTFTLDSFKITDTRSRHNDTDFVTFTLLVNSGNGNGKPQTLKKSMGDVNNGVHPVNLSFTNISVDPSASVVLNYLIVNSGHKNPSQVESTLESAGTALAVKGGAALGGAIGSVVPGLGTLLGAGAGFLAGQLVGILNANCDGAVAAEQNTFTHNDLLTRTAHGTFTQTTKHPGTNSPTGCGSNSVYFVTWHIQHVS